MVLVGAYPASGYIPILQSTPLWFIAFYHLRTLWAGWWALKPIAHNIELVLYQPYGKRVHLWNTYKLPQKRYPAG